VGLRIRAAVVEEQVRARCAHAACGEEGGGEEAGGRVDGCLRAHAQYGVVRAHSSALRAQLQAPKRVMRFGASQSGNRQTRRL